MADAARCDVCPVVADRPPDPYVSPSHWRPLPKGWVRVTASHENDPALAVAAAECCSFTCACKWVADQDREVTA